VDHNRQLCPAGKFHLGNENCILSIARRVIIKVIEANLTPGDHFGIFCELLEFGKSATVGEFRFMRMDAHSRIHEIVFGSESNAAIERRRAIAVADSNHGLDSSFACAGNHLLTICLELLAVEMGV